jgi:hypothetical protein
VGYEVGYDCNFCWLISVPCLLFGFQLSMEGRRASCSACVENDEACGFSPSCSSLSSHISLIGRRQDQQRSSRPRSVQTADLSAPTRTGGELPPALSHLSHLSLDTFQFQSRLTLRLPKRRPADNVLVPGRKFPLSLALAAPMLRSPFSPGGLLFLAWSGAERSH